MLTYCQLFYRALIIRYFTVRPDYTFKMQKVYYLREFCIGRTYVPTFEVAGIECFQIGIVICMVTKLQQAEIND